MASMAQGSYTIPDRLFFRIGDVAKILNVKPHVLRFWETEFPDVAPSKVQNKQRLYKRADVEILIRIHDLLYSQKFTIAGARKKLKELKRTNRAEDDARQMDFGLGTAPVSLDDIRAVITEMDAFLKN